MKNWYEILAQAGEEVADIFIVDFIGDWIDDMWGFGVTAKSFLEELQNLPESVKHIQVHVNSPGGDVISANHIANMLRDQQRRGRKVEVLIEGAAWSSATIITSAGNPTRIADNGLVFVHNPWSIIVGNAEEMRKEADTLDRFRDTIVATYRWKSPVSVEDLMALMDADTWMDADEAIANGFADEKIEGFSAAAALDVSCLAKLPPIPDKYKARVQALIRTEPSPSPEPAPVSSTPAVDPEAIRAQAFEEASRTARQIYDLCAKAGVPDAASEYLNRGLTVDRVKEILADAPAIRDACAAARLPDRTSGYIRAGLNLKEVRSELFDVLRLRQGPEIDNKLGIESASRSNKDIDYKEIFSHYGRKR